MIRGKVVLVPFPVEAEANYIITGDIHLLKLGGYRDIKIFNAVAFLEEISSGT